MCPHHWTWWEGLQVSPPLISAIYFELYVIFPLFFLFFLFFWGGGLGKGDGGQDRHPTYPGHLFLEALMSIKAQEYCISISCIPTLLLRYMSFLEYFFVRLWKRLFLRFVSWHVSFVVVCPGNLQTRMPGLSTWGLVARFILILAMERSFFWYVTLGKGVGGKRGSRLVSTFPCLFEYGT